MLKIYINNFRQEVRIGVTPEERAFPQILSLDLQITGDFSQAILTDNLTETLDYTEVCRLISKYLEAREWQLMEKFVYELAAFTASLNPQISFVELKACKNVMTQVDSIAVSYCFKKNEAFQV